MCVKDVCASDRDHVSRSAIIGAHRQDCDVANILSVRSVPSGTAATATEGEPMTETLKPDNIGPVDVAVILFEDSAFNGDIAPAIADLHEQGVVRVIDLAFVKKDLDGSTSAVEVSPKAST